MATRLENVIDRMLGRPTQKERVQAEVLALKKQQIVDFMRDHSGVIAVQDGLDFTYVPGSIIPRGPKNEIF